MRIIYKSHVWKNLSPKQKQILWCLQKDCDLDITTMGLCGEPLKELQHIINKYFKC